MKTDMSPQAITARLKQTSELRRLCLALGAKRLRSRKQARANKVMQATPPRC
jgi:hypothetical protein